MVEKGLPQASSHISKKRIQLGGSAVSRKHAPLSNIGDTCTGVGSASRRESEGESRDDKYPEGLPQDLLLLKFKTMDIRQYNAVKNCLQGRKYIEGQENTQALPPDGCEITRKTLTRCHSESSRRTFEKLSIVPAQQWLAEICGESELIAYVGGGAKKSTSIILPFEYWQPVLDYCWNHMQRTKAPTTEWMRRKLACYGLATGNKGFRIKSLYIERYINIRKSQRGVAAGTTTAASSVLADEIQRVAMKYGCNVKFRNLYVTTNGNVKALFDCIHSRKNFGPSSTRLHDYKVLLTKQSAPSLTEYTPEDFVAHNDLDIREAGDGVARKFAGTADESDVRIDCDETDCAKNYFLELEKGQTEQTVVNSRLKQGEHLEPELQKLGTDNTFTNPNIATSSFFPLSRLPSTSINCSCHFRIEASLDLDAEEWTVAPIGFHSHPMVNVDS